MRAHEQAPPDPGFRDRLRALAKAAASMRDAHARALQAGLAWRPIADSERARPPYELRPGTGRRVSQGSQSIAKAGIGRGLLVGAHRATPRCPRFGN